MKFILPDNLKLNAMEYTQPFYDSRLNIRGYRLFLLQDMVNLRDARFTHNLDARKKRHGYLDIVEKIP